MGGCVWWAGWLVSWLAGVLVTLVGFLTGCQWLVGWLVGVLFGYIRLPSCQWLVVWLIVGDNKCSYYLTFLQIREGQDQ